MLITRDDIDIIRRRFTEEEWRRIYSVYRAMHDNTCPKCGYTQGNLHCYAWDQRPKGVVMQCPRCGLRVTEEQQQVILAMVEHINKSRIDAWDAFTSFMSLIRNGGI